MQKKKENNQRYIEWLKKYQIAVKFYKENGHLNVPNPCTYEGINLGAWISTQRLSKKGKGHGTLNEEQIEYLNAIGMIWDVYEYKWNNNYEELKEYISKYHCLPSYYTKYNNANIGVFLHTQKNAYLCIVSCELTNKKIKLLSELGLDMNIEGYYWYRTFKEIIDTYKSNNIVEDYMVDWIDNEYQKYLNNELNENQKNRMKILIPYMKK